MKIPVKSQYNFSFFGKSGSGKTCLLAALDMQRIAHHEGYTSSRLPLEVKLPTRESWDTEKEEADRLHKSNDHLEESKKLLESGEMPHKTALRIDFLFDYKFSSQQMGECQARLIDYSGELLEPQNAPQDIAKQLREQLQDMDGLLVLAPYQSNELNILQKTLGLISFSKPIALLITKWDQSAIPSHSLTPDDLPSPAHLDLYHDLINKVGKDNCRIFSVSALGETIEGKNIPKQVNPLATFGVLDAFIWLIQHLDTIKSERNLARLQDYEKNIAQSKKWIPYPLLTLQHQGNEIVQLFSKHSELKKRAKRAHRHASLIFLSRLVAIFPSIIIILFTLLSGRQLYLDQKNYTHIQRTLHHPNTTQSELKKSEHWLENYYYISPLSHPLSWLFVVSNGKAKSELDHLRHQREQQFWQRMQEAVSLEKKIQAGKTYISMFANRQRAHDVKSMIDKYTENLREQHEQHWWTQVEQADSEFVKLKVARAYQIALPHSKHQADITKIIAQLEEFFENQKELQLWQPILKANTPHLQKKMAQIYLQKKPEGQSAALAQLVIVQADDSLREEWKKFIMDYYDLYDNGYFLEAARHLKQRHTQDHATLVRQFISTVFNSLNEYIKPLIVARKWSDAYQKLDNYRYWPNEYKQGDDKIRALRKKVEKAQDRHLYTEFLEFKDMERAKNYLDFAPLQTMKKVVTAYHQYLIHKQNSIEFTLILERIKWGDFNDSDNIITVYMDLKKIIEKTRVNAVANDSTGKIGSFTFRKKLSDQVTIEVEIIEKNWLTNYDQNGMGTYTGTLEELQYGKTIVLTPPTDDFTNLAIFRLEGIPMSPDLPEWGFDN